MRYYIGKTQVEISNEVGISQAQVSRLEKTALNFMNPHARKQKRWVKRTKYFLTADRMPSTVDMSDARYATHNFPSFLLITPYAMSINLNLPIIVLESKTK